MKNILEKAYTKCTDYQTDNYKALKVALNRVKI